MPKKDLLQIMSLLIIISVIFSALTAYFVSNSLINKGKSEDQLIKEFYEVENAVMVSPHGLRKHISDQNFVLVDLRSSEEYVEEHIVTAINIPAYRDRDNSDYGAVERIVSSFSKLREDNPDKDIIVYCYSIPCMTGRKVGKILADNQIYVKELGVGWNEWRYFWTLWNHPHEWNNTFVEDYVVSGKEPGTFTGRSTQNSCSIEGSLGC